MSLFFSNDNHSSSEDLSSKLPGIDLEPLNGSGIFSSRETTKSVHWSISWSDLMMTMFILFVILYVYKAASEEMKIPEIEKGVDFHEQRTPGPSEELSRFYEMSMQTLRAQDLEDITSVELTKDRAVKIILPSDVLFESGKAELKTGALGSLKAVAGMIKNTDYAVTVAGHTDSVPINTEKFPSNWELSSARACESARYLIRETGISPGQIQVVGYAEFSPVATNETPEGRSANRRVEIIISKELIQEGL